MRAPSILFENVSLAFDGRPLFSELSLEVAGGCCTCLLGPSGCGKSTLLGLISGNSSLSFTGKIHFAPEGDTLHTLGWMGQNDLLLPWLSVLDNVLLGAKLRKEVTPDLREKARRLLTEAGLSEYEAALPATLSGGMRQRAALLRTLMEDRPIILMDEPFSSLDALTRLKLQNLAVRMTKGKTVLLVTHDPLEALRMADRILVLGGHPTRLESVMELGGTAPRDPGNPEVSETFPHLLKKLMSEAEL